jgi:hypothetical protein
MWPWSAISRNAKFHPFFISNIICIYACIYLGFKLHFCKSKLFEIVYKIQDKRIREKEPNTNHGKWAKAAYALPKFGTGNKFDSFMAGIKMYIQSWCKIQYVVFIFVYGLTRNILDVEKSEIWLSQCRAWEIWNSCSWLIPDYFLMHYECFHNSIPLLCSFRDWELLQQQCICNYIMPDS